MKGAGRLQRLELQFYSFFTVVLSGSTFGLLFDLLRTARGYYRPNRLTASVADLLFWVVAAAALSGGLFYGNWGELRLYVICGLLVGFALYRYLASPLVVGMLRMVLRTLDWLCSLVVGLLMRLIWQPLVALFGLLVAVALRLWSVLRWVADRLLTICEAIAGFLLAPLNGPYRWCRLHYLLTKRRVKRALRHWLLGPPRKRR